MKKLMIAVAAVLSAVAVQASSVSWNSGVALNWGDGGKGWGKTAMTASSENYTMQIWLATDSAFENELTITDGDTKKKTSSKSKLGTTATTSETLAAGTTYYIKALITDSSNGSTLASQILAFKWDGSQQDPGIDFMTENGTALTSLSSIDGTFSSTTGWWQSTGWQSVPEPTSGLLLLIGVAGLALRRRRA